VFVRAMHSRAHLLFRNDIGSERGWLRIALRGTASGTDACGAIVRLTSDAGVVAQAKLCGSGFLSQDDPRLLFGLGDAPGSGKITVTWPSGTTQDFPGVPARTSLLLVEGEAEARVVKESPVTLGGSGAAAGAAP
jgi:enediyne biosynthesis protein E4